MDKRYITRIIVCTIIGLISGYLCFMYQANYERLNGDLQFPLCGARALIAGLDPYDCPLVLSNGTPAQANPATTMLAMMPFVFVPDTIAAGICFGLFSMIMGWALTQEYTWWRLLAFVSAPFWYALQVVQWSPLILAIILLPTLYPLAMVKVQAGIPIALMHFTIRRAIICIGIVLFTFILDWDWPYQFVIRLANYDGFIPAFTLFGLLLLPLIPKWRDREVQWLTLYALMPQRAFYDQLVLWMFPKTLREMMVLIIFSWIAFLGYMVIGGVIGFWAIACMYIPSAVIVYFHTHKKDQETVTTNQVL
jgi:hypothetical protein